MKDIEIKEKLYSEREAAEYFNWSLATMREIRKRGEIQYLLFQDKTVRYTLKQLQDYKDAHLVGEKTDENKQ